LVISQKEFRRQHLPDPAGSGGATTAAQSVQWLHEGSGAGSRWQTVKRSVYAVALSHRFSPGHERIAWTDRHILVHRVDFDTSGRQRFDAIEQDLVAADAKVLVAPSKRQHDSIQAQHAADAIHQERLSRADA
jgi:hypothetical protein